MNKRKKFTREFKLSVLQEIESGKTAVQVCRERDLNKDLIYRWKKEVEANPTNAFAGKGNTWKLEAKNAELERTIGKLYMENEFVKKVNTNLQAKLTESKKNR
ncbi:transposase [Candidatus Micrarchaeota archaeon]|nr:transposase [Candidatus Micrarchaeota archaeon]MBU2475852.1 transposase [Candidatus Micrarchaeota archaeon]